ncbi:MAG TPA: amidohydrolase family protein [Nocardioidaceae bacterium]
MGETWVRGRLVTTAGVVDDGLVLVAGARIGYVGPAAPDLGGDGTGGPPTLVEAPPDGFVLPGLVDLHDHGGGGGSFGEADPASAARAADEHLRHGTTSVVASTVTHAPDAMLAAVATCADAADSGRVRAVHVEGPFLNPARCGAQDPTHLRAPDVGLARDLLAAGRGHVRVMTVAPELPGAGALVGALLEDGVVPAVGHTEASPGAVRRTLADTHAALGRPGLVTHLFNGMPPLHHRAPGPVAGALAAAAAGEAVVELVADGVHLADDTVRMVLALLGPDRVALVTDAMAAAGMPDGSYPLGPRRVRVEEGVARLGSSADAPLAGGTAHLLDVVRRCVDAGIGLEVAVTAATATPAAVLGFDEGHGLGAGARADLVVTDEHLRPLRVMRAGEWTT